jgi:excisionase family DNA binding protein
MLPNVQLPEPATWSLEEAAAACGVSFMTIRRAVSDGELPAHILGERKTRFVPAEVVRWAADRAARKAGKR